MQRLGSQRKYAWRREGCLCGGHEPEGRPGCWCQQWVGMRPTEAFRFCLGLYSQPKQTGHIPTLVASERGRCGLVARNTI